MTEHPAIQIHATPHLFGAAPIATTLSAKIVVHVRDALFDGALRPGDMLGTEGELTKRFGVSRIAVRDAMKRLEASGIVEIRAGAGGGARIASGNPHLFADALAIQLNLMDVSAGEILDAQRALEMMAAELAAENAGIDDLQQIEALLAEAETKLDDVDAYTRSCFAFHLAVADAARNRVLRVQLLSFRHVAWPVHNRTLTREVAEHVLDLHQGIYTLITSGDSEGARELMGRHLKEIRTRRVAENGETIPSPQACC
ncbi:MAG: FadR/GntR family transcriptional regulator [Gammaproteobacteria bacterium]